MLHRGRDDSEEVGVPDCFTVMTAAAAAFLMSCNPIADTPKAYTTGLYPTSYGWMASWPDRPQMRPDGEISRKRYDGSQSTTAASQPPLVGTWHRFSLSRCAHSTLLYLNIYRQVFQGASRQNLWHTCDVFHSKGIRKRSSRLIGRWKTQPRSATQNRLLHPTSSQESVW
jgi:hypothetical protein